MTEHTILAQYYLPHPIGDHSALQKIRTFNASGLRDPDFEKLAPVFFCMRFKGPHILSVDQQQIAIFYAAQNFENQDEVRKRKRKGDMTPRFWIDGVEVTADPHPGASCGPHIPTDNIVYSLNF